ncbi:MAG: ParB/RepB/Spo0J family partition protein [Acidobacteria bacterium]|nr:ParB/RepB/Spo0J family partition protein [Acidobacteriota bacterium]
MKHGETLPVANIRLDGGTQPRAALDPDAINDYAKAMSNGAKFPPVTVFYDGERYWLADGFHRVKAAEAAGLKSLECDIRQGTLEDARWYSFSANKSNGLRRTTQDKQRAVKAALLHANGAAASDRQIARHVGVDQKTVTNWRQQLEASEEIPQIAARTANRKGKTYTQDTSTIGQSNRKRRRAPRRTPGAAAEPVEHKDESADPAAPARSARSQRVDRLARLTLTFVEATKHFAHLIGWLGETAGEFDEAEAFLSNTIKAIGAVSAEIERKAIAADPLNAFRLGIQEKKS